MADIRSTQNGVREAADGDHATAVRDPIDEEQSRADLRVSRAAVRVRPARPVRVRRDNVPEQHLLLDPELGEHAVDDRRRRLGRAAAGQLALGGEGDARDPRAAVARRLADEQQRRLLSRAEIREQALAPQIRGGAVTIEVEGRAYAGTP